MEEYLPNLKSNLKCLGIWGPLVPAQGLPCSSRRLYCSPTDCFGYERPIRPGARDLISLA